MLVTVMGTCWLLASFIFGNVGAVVVGSLVFLISGCVFLFFPGELRRVNDLLGGRDPDSRPPEPWWALLLGRMMGVIQVGVAIFIIVVMAVH